MAVNIYAGNLSYDMNDDSLRELFEKHGEVTSAKVIVYRDSGRSKGFGFVEMSDETAADTAIKQLNDAEILGRKIRVNYAKPKEE